MIGHDPDSEMRAEKRERLADLRAQAAIDQAMPSETSTESMEAQARPSVDDLRAQAALAQIAKAEPPTDPPPKVAARDNAGKAEWDYIFDFPTAVEALCRVMELGAVKYDRDNWKQGGKPDQEYISAMGRHISKLKKGEMFDPETGCLHIAHAMWNIAALIELNYSGITHDPELFAKMKEHWETVTEEKRRERQSHDELADETEA